MTNLLLRNETNAVGTGIREYVEEGRTVTISMSVKYASRKGTPATNAHREKVLH
jgi:hypothetical protein